MLTADLILKAHEELMVDRGENVLQSTQPRIQASSAAGEILTGNRFDDASGIRNRDGAVDRGSFGVLFQSSTARVDRRNAVVRSARVVCVPALLRGHVTAVTSGVAEPLATVRTAERLLS